MDVINYMYLFRPLLCIKGKGLEKLEACFNTLARRTWDITLECGFFFAFECIHIRENSVLNVYCGRVSCH